MKQVIGYGSLINPLSFSARYINYDFSTIYNQDLQLFDDYEVTEAKEMWNSMDISCYPATIKGV